MGVSLRVTTLFCLQAILIRMTLSNSSVLIFKQSVKKDLFMINLGTCHLENDHLYLNNLILQAFKCFQLSGSINVTTPTNIKGNAHGYRNGYKN